MDIDKRDNFIILLAGNRGVGKTTYIQGSEKLKLEGLIDVYLDRDENQKILVVDLFNSPIWRHIPIITIEKLPRWKKGIYRIFSRNKNVLFDNIEKYCYNTIIIFEDATKYIKEKLPESLEIILIDSKQKNNDVMFAFHFLMAIPVDLVRVADYLVLFKTNESFTNYYRNKYKHPEIEKAFIEVANSKNKHFYKEIALT